MPDDHSELVPLLPIPNRTVKRLSADDSADSRVKVGHRQAFYSEESALLQQGAFFFFILRMAKKKAIHVARRTALAYTERLRWAPAR